MMSGTVFDCSCTLFMEAGYLSQTQRSERERDGSSSCQLALHFSQAGVQAGSHTHPALIGFELGIRTLVLMFAQQAL